MSKILSGNQQISGATIRNVDSVATWRPALMHPWFVLVDEM